MTCALFSLPSMLCSSHVELPKLSKTQPYFTTVAVAIRNQIGSKSHLSGISK